jgi:hypothetical protein
VTDHLDHVGIFGPRDLDAEQAMGATQREAADEGYPIVDHTKDGVPIYGPRVEPKKVHNINLDQAYEDDKR